MFSTQPCTYDTCITNLNTSLYTLYYICICKLMSELVLLIYDHVIDGSHGTMYTCVAQY